MTGIYLKIQVAHFLWSAAISAFQSMVIGSGFASLNFAIGILGGIVCKVGLSPLLARLSGVPLCIQITAISALLFYDPPPMGGGLYFRRG